MNIIGTKKPQIGQFNQSVRERDRERGGQTDFLHFIPDPQLTGRQAGESGEGVYACLNVCVYVGFPISLSGGRLLRSG